MIKIELYLTNQTMYNVTNFKAKFYGYDGNLIEYFKILIHKDVKIWASPSEVNYFLLSKEQ